MWKAYATIPELDDETLKKISKGPPDWYLDKMKQKSLYTDCLEKKEGAWWWYLPRNVPHWELEAFDRLSEAKAMAYSLRDYTPEELKIWHKHLRGLTKKSKNVWKKNIKALRAELLQKNIIKKEQWDPIVEVFESI